MYIYIDKNPLQVREGSIVENVLHINIIQYTDIWSVLKVALKCPIEYHIKPVIFYYYLAKDHTFKLKSSP